MDKGAAAAILLVEDEPIRWVMGIDYATAPPTTIMCRCAAQGTNE